MKTIKKWLMTTKIMAIPRKYARKIKIYIILRRYRILIPHNDLARQILNLVKEIKKEERMLLNDLEAYQIYMLVKKIEKIDGDVAEVGVYNGGSAKIICEVVNGKNVHLFDTFEGLPDTCEMDNQRQFHKGDFSAQFESVKDYLKKYPNIYLYKGIFPLTSDPIKNKKFSFVHLDVDIYESTLNSLNFFYSRMNKGGVIISHDYPGSEGVKRAFDGFFKDKPEIVIELIGCNQCLVVKV
jgi:hypothetical protein